MSKFNNAPLTAEEIEEELVTNSLINSVEVEDENALHRLNLSQKKELLYGSQLSQPISSTISTHPPSPSLLDKSNFPSLRSASKTNSQTNKLKLPRRTSSLGNNDHSGKVINLIDDDDVEIQKEKFCLPGFVNDNAPRLIAKRTEMHVECPYYCMEGEDQSAALRRMLTHHDAWKAEYEAEMKRLNSTNLCDESEMRDSDNNQGDVYEFKSQSPIQVSKTYSNVRRGVQVEQSASPSTSQPARSQRRGSPDSDCVEVEEATMKPQTSNLGEWMTASGGRKIKRNCRTGKGKSQDNSPDVEFGFDKTWDSRSANWRDGQASGSTPTNRRTLPRTPVVEEEKVQCPICQKDFPLSKVENHAALCEGYSGAPMDVEEAS